MVNGRVWTKKEIDYLKKNYLIKDYEEMIRDLNRSYQAVTLKASKLNFPVLLGQKKISDKARKKMSETRKRLMKEGKISPPLKLPNKLKERIKELYNEGYKTKEIIKELGISHATISRVVKVKRDKKRTDELREFTTKLSNLSENERGYLAGILDGEGSIIIQPSTTYKKPNRIDYIAHLTIANQDKRIIKFVYEKLGLWTKIGSRINKVGNKDFQINVYGKGVITEFLNFIIPYCHSEKTEKRAKIMLNFCKARTHEERKRLHKEMTKNYHYRKN